MTQKSNRRASPLASTRLSAALYEVFQRLLKEYGPQHWWPGETPFEVMVGAILTQSASWNNVEKAISNLKAQGLLEPEALRRIPLANLASLIRPSGYFNAKARKLKALAEWLGTRQDDIPSLCKQETDSLRDELLAVYGVGYETADSIMLYGCGQPIFVIDAYTERIFSRLGISPQEETYAGWQSWLTKNLPRNISLFNEYHALLVCHGKSTCRKAPLCDRCCLVASCGTGRSSSYYATAETLTTGLEPP